MFCSSRELLINTRPITPSEIETLIKSSCHQQQETRVRWIQHGVLSDVQRGHNGHTPQIIPQNKN